MISETNGKKMESTAGMLGALEVAQRQYDLMHEVKAYLGQHPKARSGKSRRGLDNTFRQVETGVQGIQHRYGRCDRGERQDPSRRKGGKYRLRISMITVGWRE